MSISITLKGGNLRIFNFHSETYDWLVVAGARAQFKGTGTINGTGNYDFLLTAIEGTKEKFRDTSNTVRHKYC
jgi:hypothetical protein